MKQIVVINYLKNEVDWYEYPDSYFDQIEDMEEWLSERYDLDNIHWIAGSDIKYNYIAERGYDELPF
jgi:hypothetical protein